ncbi:MAG: ABC transporter substrate-binding protein [Lachnospiraceae bacterium]|nr:ABC transporter substrate-binding protein [Lachnospiraceae bacterium]
MSFLCKCPSHRIIRTTLAVTMTALMLLLAGCASNQPADSNANNAAGQADISAKSEATDMTDSAAGQSTTGQADVSAESKAPDMADSTADQSSSAQDRADTSCPKSVVAASKSNADLWLLAGGELSGTTEDAMELDGISENTAVVGTLSKPNSEAILALEPDLVLLAVDIPAQKELKAELDEMGIRTMAVDINSFEDYKSCMKELTGLTGREDLYEKNALQVGERIEAIKAEVTNGDTKTFLALRVSATKNKVLKDDYFACEIFRDFGLRNIAEDDSRIDELNIEAIVAANPDYIFIIPQGKESEAMESYKTQFESNEVWSSLDAVNRGRLYTMPKDYFQYKPNAQWDLAYEYVRDLLKES